MTTHHRAVRVLGRRHRVGKVVGAALAAIASAFCVVAMISNVTWAEETNWFLFAFAGFGVVGFGIWSLGLWQEWPKDREPAWTIWFGAVFWAAFGLYQASVPLYVLFISDADPNWLVVAIAPILAVGMFWLAYRDARTARER